ncbi:unnamed protein product [Linum tenue]|uniref:C2H2-type domain-containing protein n=1 Tax=Linum tenue TaxID=586396 RepID=A0AAV0R3S0_9ROSI|nr:unnamed protein product [Linum tenue]
MCRRPDSDEGSNPLDLNNLPDDHSASSSSSNAAARDDAGKVYECRFCALRFCKSQALGGHMNRHRQERETETLNRARQLVLNNDGGHILGYQYPVAPPGSAMAMGRGDPLFNRPVVPPLYQQHTGSRLFSAAAGGGSTSPLTSATAAGGHHLPPPYLYPAASPPRGSSTTRVPPHQPAPYSNNDYYIGHVLNAAPPPPPGQLSSTYTCVGAPVGHRRLGSDGSSGTDGGSLSNNSASNHHQDEYGNGNGNGGLNWGSRSYAA